MYNTKLSGRLQRMTGWILCLALFLALALPVLAAYPTHTDFISDPEEFLTANTKATVVSTNETLYREKEVKIALCLTASTGSQDIAAFSRGLFTEWKMCDGVLLVLDTTAQTYFAVQSVDVDDILTNTVLSDILTANLEPDFSAGNIDQGIAKTVVALAQYMHGHLPGAEGNPAGSQTDTAEGSGTATEDKPSVFLTICKVLLWIIVIAAILAVAIFVVALFNDDVADLLRTYVFRRGTVPAAARDYYDDRLYGTPQNRQNPQRRNGQPPQGYRPAPGGSQQPRRQAPQYNPYDDYEMQYRQSAPANGRNRQNPYGGQQNGTAPRNAAPNRPQSQTPRQHSPYPNRSRGNNRDNYGY